MAKEKYFNVNVETICTQLGVLGLIKNEDDFYRLLNERKYEVVRDLKPNGTVVLRMDYNDAVDLRRYLSKEQRKVERSNKRRRPHSCNSNSLEKRLD